MPAFIPQYLTLFGGLQAYLMLLLDQRSRSYMSHVGATYRSEFRIIVPEADIKGRDK